MALIIISRMTGGRCCFAPIAPPPDLWPRNSTGLAPGVLPEPASQSASLRPGAIRGRLYFQISDVLFPAFTTFTQAAIARFAAEAHRLGIADEAEALVVERADALAEMRKGDAGMPRFIAACEREAELVVGTRQLRAEVSHG